MPKFTYVYLLQSQLFPDRRYTGLTTDLHTRLAKHNEAGAPHTATAFTNPLRAAAFERYLKTASGRSFAKKHL